MWHTVRPLGWRQMATRARVTLLRRWWRVSGHRVDGSRHCHLAEGPGSVVDLVALAAEHVQARRQLEAIAVNSFKFLAVERRFREDIAWHAPDLSRLWRYHLHYFGYGRELMLADSDGGGDGVAQFRRLVTSWITANRVVQGDGWHPYTLSLRLVAWLKAAGFWAERLAEPGQWRDEFTGSLRDQADHLVRQLEHDVRGNHLFENGRALLWLGLMSRGDDAADWERLGRGILEREVPEQVLTDGSHFERCPGYHFSVLLSLVELGCLYELRGRPVPSWLADAVRGLRSFGARILLPDGTYPLIKDSAHDQLSVRPADVLHCAACWEDRAAAGTERATALRTILYFGRTRPPVGLAAEPRGATSGFCLGRGADEMVVMDAGQPCPSYLPAHAHADALSFVFFAAGGPLVVDPGVYEYVAGPWRDYFRSTRAHNTVAVDGLDSSEVWSSFRVGRRAHVRLLEHRCGPGLLVVVAEHDGFARQVRGRRHRRLLAWREGEWLAVVDLVTGPGRAEVASHLHFHPDIAVNEAERTEYGWRSVLGPTGWHLLSLGDTRPELSRGQLEPAISGWYSAEFGRREPATTLQWRREAVLPSVTGYVLARDPMLAPRIDAVAGGWNIVLESVGRCDTYSLPRPDAP